MAQTGYTPIQLYLSSTAAAVPLAANLAAGELAINTVDGKLYYKSNAGVVTLLASTSGASGDVVGPASSTDNALARFDLATGKLIQNSVGILSDAGILTGLTGITSSGAITLSSLTSGRVTFAGASGLLQDSANLTFSGSALAVTGTISASAASAAFTGLQVGTSNSVNSGLIIGNKSSGTGAIWSTSITPSATNYAFHSDGGQVAINASTSATLNVANSIVASATSTGLTVTGNITANQNSTGTVANFQNTDATNGYGVSIAAGGTSATRYALVIRNDAGTQDWFKLSSETGQVGNSILAPGAPGSPVVATISTSGIAVTGTTTSSDRFIVSASTSAGVTDISYGSYAGGNWINAPSGNTSYVAIAGTSVMSWNAAGITVPAGTLTVAGTGSRGVRLQGVGVGEVAIAGDGTTYVLSNAFYNTTSYASMMGGMFSYTAGGTFQYLALGPTYNSTSSLYVLANGNVGVGMGAPATKLDVNGTLRFTPNTSDLNYSASIYGNYNSAHPFQIDVKNNGSTFEMLGAYADGGGSNNRLCSPSFPVVIGTTSQTTVGEKLLVSGYAGVVSDSVAAGIYAGASGTKDLNFYSNGNSQFFTAARIRVSSDIYTDAGMMAFWTTSNNGSNVLTFSEKARITSDGNFLVAGTSPANINGNGGFYVNPNSLNTFTVTSHLSGASSGSPYAYFYYANTDIGSITQTGTTGVLYNVTSDYRLKTVVGAVTGQGARIDALEPIEYTWNSDGSRTRGFLAHKFQEVYAGSVTGAKDAINADGKPVYQAMQAATSEVIADLVAEIQSLRKRLAAANL